MALTFEVHQNDTGNGRVTIEIHPTGDEHGEYVIADFYGTDARVLAEKMVELYNKWATS